MNYTLEVIKQTDAKERAILVKYGSCFFDGAALEPVTSIQRRRKHPL